MIELLYFYIAFSYLYAIVNFREKNITFFELLFSPILFIVLLIKEKE